MKIKDLLEDLENLTLEGLFPGITDMMIEGMDKLIEKKQKELIADLDDYLTKHSARTHVKEEVAEIVQRHLTG